MRFFAYLLTITTLFLGVNFPTQVYASDCGFVVKGSSSCLDGDIELTVKTGYPLEIYKTKLKTVISSPDEGFEYDIDVSLGCGEIHFVKLIYKNDAGHKVIKKTSADTDKNFSGVLDEGDICDLF